MIPSSTIISICLRCWLILLFATSHIAHAEEKIVVMAAASLSNALSEINRQFEQSTGIQIRASFAASSTLAKQIENGAPADIFISADSLWMDYLAEKNSSIKSSKQTLLGNSLVLIAPKGQSFTLALNKQFSLADSYSGKLCTGETASVPAGIYAKQALSYLGWWEPLKARIVGAQDVRGALNFVERGECIGIVYLTDALQSNKVEIMATFPPQSHEQIVYPVAQVSPQKNAQRYMQFLFSEQAKKIFIQYGFQL